MGSAVLIGWCLVVGGVWTCIIVSLFDLVD